jgi:sulfate/thiosulfate transport system permease protein
MSIAAPTVGPTPSGNATRASWRAKSALPGFVPSFAFALCYLSIVVLLPLAALVLRPWSSGWDAFVATIVSPRVIAALRVSFTCAALAAFINGVFGFLVAWVTVRYRFPGQRFIDALIDLPFALPTAVAGIALSALYAPNGWLGAPLAALGIKIAFTPSGIVTALTFIGLPFVVRTLGPVLEELDREQEEAAATLGASRRQVFFRVLLPTLAPTLATGMALALARGIGEYGSVIFIAGNLPLVSEIAPLLIVVKLEQYDYAGAAAIGVVMLLISFVLLFAINLLQGWAGRRR